MASIARNRAKYLIGVLVCLLLGWFGFVRGVTVPLLGLVDLAFHELGHLLTYPFPDIVTAMMGSVTQVAVPVGLALYFLFLRHAIDRAGAIAAGVKGFGLSLLFAGFAICLWCLVEEEPRAAKPIAHDSPSPVDWVSR